MMVARYFEVFPCGEVPGEVLQGTQRCLDDECDHESQQESRNRSEPKNNLKWINLVSAWVAVGVLVLVAQMSNSKHGALSIYSTPCLPA